MACSHATPFRFAPYSAPKSPRPPDAITRIAVSVPVAASSAAALRSPPSTATSVPQMRRAPPSSPRCRPRGASEAASRAPEYDACHFAGHADPKLGQDRVLVWCHADGFAAVDASTSELPALVEMQGAHARLMEAHARISGVWAEYDVKYWDYDKEGEGHVRYHPEHLPAAHELLPVSQFNTESDFLQSAQRTWSRVVHHGRWLALWQRLAAVSTREAVRLVAVGADLS